MGTGARPLQTIAIDSQATHHCTAPRGAPLPPILPQHCHWRNSFVLRSRRGWAEEGLGSLRARLSQPIPRRAEKGKSMEAAASRGVLLAFSVLILVARSFALVLGGDGAAAPTRDRRQAVLAKDKG